MSMESIEEGQGEAFLEALQQELPGIPAPPESGVLPFDEEPAEERHDQLKAILEALVYVTEEPLAADQLARVLEVPKALVVRLLSELASDTDRADRGVWIREVAGGYMMATKPEHHEVVRHFVKKLTRPLKLSSAALETLAVVAYKQPVTVPEITAIRGVQGASAIKTLLDHKLLATAGRKNVIGRPILYKTTKDFLMQFGLKNLDELPTLKEFEELSRIAFQDDEPDPVGEGAGSGVLAEGGEDVAGVGEPGSGAPVEEPPGPRTHEPEPPVEEPPTADDQPPVDEPREEPPPRRDDPDPDQAPVEEPPGEEDQPPVHGDPRSRDV